MSVSNIKKSTPRSQSNQRTYESYIRNMASSPNMGRSTTNTSHPPAPPSIGVGQTPPSAEVSKPETAGGFTLEVDSLALGNPTIGDTVSFTVASVDRGVAVLGTPILLKNKVPPTL
ncbi:MAG: hypothetical protein WC455_25365 [Dehalococcoidia bacterium]|jgi:hypothetical protein